MNTSNTKHHCSIPLFINKLALSLQYSHFINTSSTKHHCSIPVSKRLTFPLIDDDNPGLPHCAVFCKVLILVPHDVRPIVDNAATTFQLLLAVNHTQQYQWMVLQHDEIKIKIYKGTSSWQDRLVCPASISILASQGHIEEVFLFISSLNRYFFYAS